nr:palindromic element RPE5 domain-containing protein [Rickettsia tamurae]
MEKSKESVSRGAERILNVQHPRTYKDDIYSHAFKFIRLINLVLL